MSNNIGESHPVPPNPYRHDKEPAWREQFPVDVPDDEYRSRRDFTKLLGLTSFAFVVGQGYIVCKSISDQARGPLPEADIAGTDELAIGAAKIFHYPDHGDACVLVRVSETEYLAYGQKCSHLSCPVIPEPHDGKFHCPCHEGSFDLYTGEPLAGPPRRALPAVKLAIREGRIIAVGMAEGHA